MKGRGAQSNPPSRFLATQVSPVEDGWYQEPAAPGLPTRLHVDTSRTVISRNRSPDIPFDHSVNPYRGCEHGCVFCYARPTHAWLGLSAGLDFETELFHKPDAARQLRAELAQPGYHCRPIMLGANTDPYQPIERTLRITRSLLEVLQQAHHPLAVTTRSALVLRDLDLLAPMARAGLAMVWVSLTTLDAGLKRQLEPRSASAAARLRVVRELSAAGVPVGVMAAPMIPAVNDAELESILAGAAAAGATFAGYSLLRLPHEVAGLFRDWLRQYMPDRAAHVMSLLRAARGGKDNDPAFGRRMRGQGAWAGLLRDRFRLAVRRHGLAGERGLDLLDTTRFRAPAVPARGGQLSLDW